MANNAYEYFSKCYSVCSQPLFMDDFLLKCVEICPKSTYVFERKCEKCHPDCIECNGPFNDTNSNCISCLSPDKFLENGNCIKNVYTTNAIYEVTTKDLIKDITTELIQDITTYKVKDISTIVIPPDITTDMVKDISTEIIFDTTTTNIEKDITTELIPDITTDIKKEISTDIKTDIIKDISTCAETLKLYNKDKYINIASLCNITNNTMIYDIIKENILPLFDPENDFDLIVEAFDDIIFQITTSKNQIKELTNNSMNDYNLSKLDIAKCETILKRKKNINDNDNLIILKKEKKTSKNSEKEIQLELYDPYNRAKLDSSFCKNTTINILVKAELSDEMKYSYKKLNSLKYELFNINSPFYQDICTEYTSNGGTGMTLSDRINYIYNNGDIKCQPNCIASEYSEELKYLNCSCDINIEINYMNEKFNSKNNYENSYDDSKYSSYKVIKCYNLIFSEFFTTKNKGRIIASTFIVINLGCLVFFIIKRINPIKNKLLLKINSKFINEDINNMNNNDITITRKYENSKDNNKFIKKVNPPRRKSFVQSLKFSKDISNIKNISDTKNNLNKENLTKTINLKKRKKIKRNSNKRFSVNLDKKINLCDNSMNRMNNITNKKSKEKINFEKKEEKEKKTEIKKELDNFELNQLKFHRAINLDKRAFIQMYWNLLKREHPIIFTFFVYDDYNLIYIKLVKFVFLLATYMIMNILFFSDKIMHKLYLNNGIYDFVQHLPQIIYSNIISGLIEILLCYLSLTDKSIYKIKHLMLLNLSEKMRLVYKCIKIKLIIFFSFTFVFIIFYWYIISSFCSVYKNSQIIFIKDWIFSFLLGMIIPFFIYLIPSSLRKFSSYFYKCSKLIPIY